MTASPPATSAIEIGTELIFDPPSVRLSALRAVGKRMRRVPSAVGEACLGHETPRPEGECADPSGDVESEPGRFGVVAGSAVLPPIE